MGSARGRAAANGRRILSAQPEIVIHPDLASATADAAERTAEICERAVAARGACAIALSGGETPKPLLALLAAEPYRSRIPWPRVHVFWGDERCVPPDDPRSNYRLAYELLLSKVAVPANHVYRMQGETADHVAAAAAYAETLRAGLPKTADGWPRFDFVLLGLGDNAHTASLFPRSQALEERERAVVAEFVQDVGMWRMTLTVPVLTHAAETIVLAAGVSKAEAVRASLEGPPVPDVPGAFIRPVGGHAAWLLDAGAASRLTGWRPAADV